MKYFYLLQKLIIPYLLIIFFFKPLQAQNPADPDTTIGLGAFNGEVRDIKLQADGKMLIAGSFTYYRTTPVNSLVRLNSDGSVDNSFNIGSGADTSIYQIAIQTDGKILIGGFFNSFNGTAMNRIARLNADGSVDNSFNIGSGADTSIYQIAIQTDGKILIGGLFSSFNGIAMNHIARLNMDGSVDNSFNIGSGVINYEVYTIAIQGDGKILAGGYFNYFNGNIVRLNPDGSVDNSFNIGSGADAYVYSIAIQGDGKIVIAGSFDSFNGTSNKHDVARLNTDGSVDNSFDVGTAGFASYAKSIAIQPDGKILIGGNFTSFSGFAQSILVRLNTNGSVDNSFTTNSTANSSGSNIFAITIQSDGKILAGGNFANFSSVVPTRRLIRFNDNGSLDNSFNPVWGAITAVYNIAIQSDEKILVGIGGPVNRLIRLHPDGTVDGTFNSGSGANGQIYSIALQGDGKILLVGTFTSFNGVSYGRIVRLNPNGSIDNSFNIGSAADFEIDAIAIQADGKIIIGGIFSSFNGIAKNHLARLNADGSIDNSFNIGSGSSSWINSISIQEDGKILIGGFFTSFNGSTKYFLARLNSNGLIDNTFNIGLGASSYVFYITTQKDGKILVGGLFLSFNGVSKNKLVRLNPDGTIDNTFNTGSGANSIVRAVTMQADEKIIVGGDFTSFNNIPNNHIIRLNPNGSIDNTFNSGSGISGTINSIILQSDGKIVVGGGFSGYQNIPFNSIVRLYGNSVYNHSISGKIYTDNNLDCDFNIIENPLSFVMVKALPGPYYGSSDKYGRYQVKVDSGTTAYTFSQQYNTINSKRLVNQCASTYNVFLTGAAKDTCCFNFADSVKACALLNIDIQSSRMRRCLRSNTYVNYCNYGDADASNVQIRVEYPSYISPISSVPIWSSKIGSVLIYDVATVLKSSCGKIIIADSVVCNNEEITGLTQCINASIFPSFNCIAENPSWDRSSTIVIGSCVGSVTHFDITNSGSGDMSDSLEYRIYVNDTLIFTSNYKLASNQSLSVNYPAAGQTVRLEADQHLFHPGMSRPRVTIEGCGAGAGIEDLVITASPDDLDNEVAIACNVIRDSYDPNNKHAMPEGIGAAHKVAPDTELEYTIRFQNTGTDTAYTVRVVDTLDVNLDPASFTQGASSHPYTLNISGKGQAVLAFNFYNINLPDSTKNKLGSNGLVSFRITVPANATLGTQIKNKAHIFFDYNSPIITNETMHIVDNTVAEDLSKGSLVQVGQVVSGVNNGLNKLSVKIYPNPTAGIITVEMSESNNNLELHVISITGVIQKTVKLNNTSVQQVNMEGINQGIYLYEIWEQGERKAGGMLQVK